MSARVALLGLFIVIAVASSSRRVFAEAVGCSIKGHPTGVGSSWDDAVVDQRAGRLYLAQAGVAAEGRLAFIASADSATLSIIAVRSVSNVTLVQTLDTQVGTRSGAVDIDSGRGYLPSARFGPPKAPNPYPTVEPGTFAFFVIAPN